jgi:hypothetical protein
MYHLCEMCPLFNVFLHRSSISIPIDYFHRSVIELILLFYVWRRGLLVALRQMLCP